MRFGIFEVVILIRGWFVRSGAEFGIVVMIEKFVRELVYYYD